MLESNFSVILHVRVIQGIVVKTEGIGLRTDGRVLRTIPYSVTPAGSGHWPRKTQLPHWGLRVGDSKVLVVVSFTALRNVSNATDPP